jgi:dTDP-4-dehydrorhamnose 3,5-epimerase
LALDTSAAVAGRLSAPAGKDDGLPFTIESVAELPDVKIISPVVHEDLRGAFLESYRRSDMLAIGISDDFVQDNISVSRKGVIRGLHFQNPPSAQAKLVSAVRGRIFDVAVDIRSASPTRGRWCAVELSSEDHRMLYVPAGFAHGFAALSDEVIVHYKVSHDFDPDNERGLSWNDPLLAILWPVTDPVLSARDSAAPTLAEADIRF